MIIYLVCTAPIERGGLCARCAEEIQRERVRAVIAETRKKRCRTPRYND